MLSIITGFFSGKVSKILKYLMPVLIVGIIGLFIYLYFDDVKDTMRIAVKEAAEYKEKNNSLHNKIEELNNDMENQEDKYKQIISINKDNIQILENKIKNIKKDKKQITDFYRNIVEQQRIKNKNLSKLIEGCTDEYPSQAYTDNVTDSLNSLFNSLY